MKILKFIFLYFLFNFNIIANEEVLRKFENDVKKNDDTFKTFNIKEGEAFFRFERINSKGKLMSCMTCHSSNPKNAGLTKANKTIAPLAPIANQERFTDINKVEKWFKRNCNDVYDRECTVMEKGNFIKFMMSIK